MTASTRVGRAVVGVVDYSAGNVQSIDNAFDHVGAEVRRIRSHGDLAGCSHIVLPGVGAFGFCAEKLMGANILDALTEWVFARKRPLLGICVGMQLMADSSEESPEARGLGWIGGSVTRISAAKGLRVPHVGWNTVTFERGWADFPAGSAFDFYFDHSYAYGSPAHGAAIGTCVHGSRFSAVLEHENIIAAQFHPEKSQTAGLRFLSSFLRI